MRERLCVGAKQCPIRLFLWTTVRERLERERVSFAIQEGETRDVNPGVDDSEQGLPLICD